MGVFKLGKMTFGSLFKKPETVLYPIEQKEPPEGLKGHIVIDAPMCILCGLCERSCPTDCITVSKPEAFWQINRFGCVQCGYCTTVCPKGCLAMSPGYAPAATERAPERFTIPVQDKKAKNDKPTQTRSEGVPEPARETQAAPAAPAKARLDDAELLAKMALLDPAKAEKVKEALKDRRG